MCECISVELLNTFSCHFKIYYYEYKMLCKPHSNQNQKPTVNTPKIKRKKSKHITTEKKSSNYKENKKRKQKGITTHQKKTDKMTQVHIYK